VTLALDAGEGAGSDAAAREFARAMLASSSR